MTASARRPASSTVALHWAVAFGVLFMLALGFFVSGLPRGPGKTEWVQIHKSFGMIVFALALARIAWRLKVGFPQALVRRDWEIRAARLSHVLLLAATMAAPLSGILRSISYARPVSVFGATVIPQILTEKHEALNEIAGAIHDATAWTLLVLIALHAAAAVKHYVVDRDDTLIRMVPGADRPPREAAR